MISSHSATIELARELISRPSITPVDGGCQEHIQSLLTAAGFMCENMRFGNVDNLWARIGTEIPLFVFAGHTDVVPTGPETEWSSPPFQPRLQNGCLYGRGASDMKAAIAAMVTAATHFTKKHKRFKGSIAFLLTSDEEGPAIDGTRKVMEVLEQRGIKIDYCMIGEPSSDKTVGDQIRVGRRGSLHGRLIIHGKQGHVAHPHLAINPIHTALPALQELTREVWDQGNEEFPPTTFQITNMHAGTGAANVIPGHLEVIFNFRFSTAVTIDILETRVEAIFKRHNLPHEIQWTLGAEPFLTKSGKLIAATTESIQAITGLTPKLSTGGGTSDGRFIAPTGAELVELGVSHATAHHIDENASVEDIEKLTEIYEDILTRLLG